MSSNLAGEIDPGMSVLLEMAEERSLDRLLNLVVTRVAERSDVALARIWLIRPGDICSVCRWRKECPDQTRCLHLVASSGNPRSEPGADWSRIDGSFRRFPIGMRKIGRVAVSAETIVITDVDRDSPWIANPEWIDREGIRGFVGQPLVYRGDPVGVFAVFLRETPTEGCVAWQRVLSDHAAAAIANARAFEEIDRLRTQLELENEYLRGEALQSQEYCGIVGASPAMRNVCEQIDLVAKTDANVLILGESGTGKELVACEIHQRSERRDRPLVRVNCASIPRELYESEFFGHVRGSFTGAVKDRAGRFELADGGTIFLDEVGEIPLELQSKLLRVVQERQFERVGDERTREVDVRIVAATNRDLKREVAAGRFREDLFYRLNVFPLEVAPLRERAEDIQPLAAHFLQLAATKFGRTDLRLTQANVLELQHHTWPGNVRELQNIVERAVITSRGRKLRFDLPRDESAGAGRLEFERAASSDAATEVVFDRDLKRMERENLLAALKATEWKIYGPGGAAELLNMKPTTLSSRIRRMGLKRPV
ncbi:MAG: sigma 54-interacting transcriptional regulator [Planctomycetes bacterium]|nr:sigma 54-interacting transcriptional regulator [Planctomycetota bacterium]